jgi:polar amino acid transport system substrate-binding protein
MQRSVTRGRGAKTGHEGGFPVRLALAAAALLLPAVASAEPVIVGIDSSFPPHQYLNSRGEPAGFDLDLFRAVAEVQGIEYEVRTATWDELRQQLEKGEIDVNPGVVQSEARDVLLDFSVPTVLVHHSIFVRDDSNIEQPSDLRGAAVAVQRSGIWDDIVRERGYPVELEPMATPSETLQSLASGQAEGAVLLLDQGLFLIRDLGLEGIRSIGGPFSTMAYRFAVPEGREELLAKLNDGLVEVRASGRYDALHDRWFGVLHEPSFWGSRAAAVLGGAAGLALLGLGAALAWSRTLQRRVERRTRELVKSQEQERQLQAQLLHSQKMEALGRLAGGVAHDFNNVLTVILGGLALARDGLDQDDRLREPVESAYAAARSAADVTKQLLAFSRKQRVEPKPLSWNRLLEEQVDVLRRLIGSPMTLEMALDPDLPEILVDPGQASQILLNLVVNARDATVGQGKVRISTQLVDVGDERFVRLSVADDGVGMEADISEQIFEPFFSTKGEEGTGLGLSTIYGIATQHGGKVSVQSTPSVGSVFHVDLPPASRPADTSG